MSWPLLAWVDRFTIFFFQAEDGIRDYKVTGVQTCALPISVGLAAGLPERLVDDVHAVKRANGEHVRIASESILVALHEGRVHRGLMVVVVKIGRASCRERV